MKLGIDDLWIEMQSIERYVLKTTDIFSSNDEMFSEI